jgi:hypothetical protein
MPTILKHSPNLIGVKQQICISKAIPVTGRGGLWDCEMLRIPYCLDNRLTDGVKVVSPMQRLCSTPQKHYFSVSGIHFC